MTKPLCTLLIVLMIFGVWCGRGCDRANAAPVTCEGVGRYYMERTDETLGQAKQKAKTLAKRNAVEQALLELANSSTEEEGYLTEDDISAVAAGFVKVLEIRYDITKTGDGIKCVTVTIKAEVDVDAARHKAGE